MIFGSKIGKSKCLHATLVSFEILSNSSVFTRLNRFKFPKSHEKVRSIDWLKKSTVFDTIDTWDEFVFGDEFLDEYEVFSFSLNKDGTLTATERKPLRSSTAPTKNRADLLGMIILIVVIQSKPCVALFLLLESTNGSPSLCIRHSCILTQLK